MADTIYDEVEKYVKTRANKYRSFFPHDWEDGIQEGMIQAWKDIENGVEPKLKVLRRAAMATERYFQYNCERSFGKPVKSRDGITSNSKTLDKVQIYTDEFLQLHGRFPTGKEAQDALGISNHSANVAIRKIREGRIDHMKYVDTPSGAQRQDYSHYNVVHLESFQTGSSDGSNNKSWDSNPYLPVAQESFESDLLSEIEMENHIKKLLPKHQQVLVWHLYEGYNTGDVGRKLGYEKSPSQHGTKAINSAINQLHTVMDPYFGECKKGHARTEENTSVTQGSDGYYRRHCLACKSKNGGQNKKV